jgi:putative FmdB family regulatory protein
MPMYDYRCENEKCGKVTDDIVPAGTEVIECSECGAEASRIFIKSPPILTTIIPAYSGCKKHKAGYSHTHADRPRTHVQGKGWSADK